MRIVKNEMENTGEGLEHRASPVFLVEPPHAQV